MTEYSDNSLQQLVLNKVSAAKYKEMASAGTLDENQLYIVDSNDSSNGGSLPLLTTVWSDHIINDLSWVRSDTFSWQSGNVYEAAYNKLVEEYDSVPTTRLWAWKPDPSYGTLPPENISLIYSKSYSPTMPNGICDEYGNTITDITVANNIDSAMVTIQYDSIYYTYRIDETLTKRIPSTITNEQGVYFATTPNGFKIALPDQEEAIVNAYNDTGIAWFYILDTENKQFKLPRTKFGFTGLRTNAGNTVEAGLPNITGKSGWIKIYGTGATGAFLKSTTSSQAYTGTSSQSSTSGNIVLDASDSNSIYGSSETVQPPATEMYLYFYVGNYTQSAIEQTAGITSETINGKLDTNLANASQTTKETIVGWGMPDLESKIEITSMLTTSPYSWTAPCDGLVKLYAGGGNKGWGISSISISDSADLCYINTESGVYITSYFPVSKNKTIYSTERTGNSVMFFPLKGTN